jgi:replicative DNA helicase
VAQLDAARGVYAGIFPDRRDLFMEAERLLSEDHFVSEAQRALWRWAVRYWEIAHEVMPRSMVLAQAEKIELSKRVSVVELYDACAGTQVSDGEFHYYVEELRTQRMHALTGDALTNAMELLTRGGEVDGEEVEPGPVPAWDLLQREYARITQLSARETAPEGDVWAESDRHLLEYSRRKEDAVAGRLGVTTGIGIIDKHTGGFQPGDLVLIAGYVSAGKSQLCVQIAYHSSVERQQNVVYITTETSRQVTSRRLIARHSRAQKFQGLPLDSKKLKTGSLTTEEERRFQEVVHDLHAGVANGAYGHLYIAQVPVRPTLGYVESIMRRVQVSFPVDLLVIDYLALLAPERRRESTVAEKAELVQQAKVLATTFNNGHGVPLITPWQVRRESYERAKTEREFDDAVTAETSEADKSADVTLSLLKLREQKNRIMMQFLKNRDGEIPPRFEMEIDYASSRFIPTAGARADYTTVGR